MSLNNCLDEERIETKQGQNQPDCQKASE